MNEKRLPIFVYGTLRPGQKNYSRFLAGRTAGEVPATVSGRLYFVRDGGYPYALPGEGQVSGEVVFLAADLYGEILAALDELEDYDPRDEKRSLYLRREADALLKTGERVQVWIYYWNDDPDAGDPLPEGDFSRLPG